MNITPETRVADIAAHKPRHDPRLPALRHRFLLRRQASRRRGLRRAELEKALHEHIHLENNVLFPRAARLEEELSIAL